MHNNRRLLILGLILSISTGIGANDADVDENSLFGGDSVSEDALFGAAGEGDAEVGEEALFGEGLLSEAEEDSVDLAQEFLQGSADYLLNGDIRVTATSSR